MQNEFSKVTDLKVYVEPGSEIYANGMNMIPVTVSFTTWDSNNSKIDIPQSQLIASTTLLNYNLGTEIYDVVNAPDIKQPLGSSVPAGWVYCHNKNNFLTESTLLNEDTTATGNAVVTFYLLYNPGKDVSVNASIELGAQVKNSSGDVFSDAANSENQFFYPSSSIKAMPFNRPLANQFNALINSDKTPDPSRVEHPVATDYHRQVNVSLIPDPSQTPFKIAGVVVVDASGNPINSKTINDFYDCRFSSTGYRFDAYIWPVTWDGNKSSFDINSLSVTSNDNKWLQNEKLLLSDSFVVNQAINISLFFSFYPDCAKEQDVRKCQFLVYDKYGNYSRFYLNYQNLMSLNGAGETYLTSYQKYNNDSSNSELSPSQYWISDTNTYQDSPKQECVYIVGKGRESSSYGNNGKTANNGFMYCQSAGQVYAGYYGFKDISSPDSNWTITPENTLGYSRFYLQNLQLYAISNEKHDTFYTNEYSEEQFLFIPIWSDGRFYIKSTTANNNGPYTIKLTANSDHNDVKQVEMKCEAELKNDFKSEGGLSGIEDDLRWQVTDKYQKLPTP